MERVLLALAEAPESTHPLAIKTAATQQLIAQRLARVDKDEQDSVLTLMSKWLVSGNDTKEQCGE